MNQGNHASVYETYREKFNTDQEAKRYSYRHVTSKKGQREMNCIKRALSSVPQNAFVLDLPCGTGRLSYFIHSLGYRVLGADCSEHMLHYAKQQLVEKNVSPEAIQLEQQEVAAIKHADHTFDATVCNRLFHHYPDSSVRQKALKELSRVTNGPIIVSFFNSFSLSAMWSQFKNFLKNKKPQDRISIPFSEFKKDIQAAGLKIEGTYYTLFGVSPQMYVKLVKQ